MSQKSLGIIETIGLTAAVEAADTALKAAAVELVGYELSKGSGMTVVKVEGNVGAVKAAIDAAAMAAVQVGTVVSTRVIPRPSRQIEILVRNSDTVGYEKTPSQKSDVDADDCKKKQPQKSDTDADDYEKKQPRKSDADADDQKGQKASAMPAGLKSDSDSKSEDQAANIAQTDSDPSANIAQTGEAEADHAGMVQKPISAAVQDIPEIACVREALWPATVMETEPEAASKAASMKAAAKPELEVVPKLEASPKPESAAISEPEAASKAASMKAAAKPASMETIPESENYTCNLCKDPNCPRQKGDLKQLCIHYRKKK